MKTPTPDVALSPMMRHFLEVKALHPDCLIFYRCGDFYETFFEDAKIASRELDIVLTTRDKSSDHPIPLAGVPYHAVNQYLTRLIDKGYKVAIVEQMEDPKLAKGMVKREVVRVVTPGLVLDPESLPPDANNYTAALCLDGRNAGLASLDLSTGEFACTELEGIDPLRVELARLNPREVLLSENERPAISAGADWPPPNAARAFLPEIEFGEARAKTRLMEQFQVSTLAGFGLDRMPLAMRAAGALLAYVQQTQKQNAPNISSLRTYASADFMVMDETTRLNLEIERSLSDGTKKGSLLGVIDLCRTPLGSRTLRRWLSFPLQDVRMIRTRQVVVEEFHDQQPQRQAVREVLAKIGDLMRLISRIALNRSGARDLVSLAGALRQAAELRENLDLLRPDLFASFVAGIEPQPDLAEELERALRDDPPLSVREGRMFKKGYETDLDRLIDLAEHGKEAISRIETKERERTGISTLKVRFNRVFGYYIELSSLNAKKAPADYIRKQTLVNAERFVTPELKEFEEQVLHAEEKRNELEFNLFEKLRQRVIDRSASLLKTAETVGSLDALAALAELAARNDYVRPRVTEEQVLSIEDGRHPVVEQTMKGEPFIPNDIHLDTASRRLIIITGPNMAGKSTIMRQTALIVLLAQIGSFVPARSAEIGLVDRIFTRVGATDSLARGLSTFMVEMTETANILHNATKRSLILLDEIGRGTSTFDGLSIAWAVAEHIHDRIGAKTLFATHYHELTDLVKTKEGVFNRNVAVKEWQEKIIFLRKLMDGPANRSYGIQVGRLAGLPPLVIERAKEVLNNLEKGELDENGMPSIARRFRRKENPNQLSLFAQKAPGDGDWLIRELDRLQLETLAPIEAMNRLFEWKARREKERGNG